MNVEQRVTTYKEIMSFLLTAEFSPKTATFTPLVTPKFLNAAADLRTLSSISANVKSIFSSHKCSSINAVLSGQLAANSFHIAGQDDTVSRMVRNLFTSGSDE